MKYIVIEFQTFANGAMSTPSWSYDDFAEAKAKYYTVLAAAVVSDLPVHSCAIMNNEGTLINKECIRHPVEEEEENEQQNV